MPEIFNMADPLARQNGLAAAVAALRADALVAFPTETVYGLGADAARPKAVAAVFQAKRRPAFNPLIVHVAHPAEAAGLAMMSPEARVLARTFWPGPLTLVLDRLPGAGICDEAAAGLATIAIRVPAEPVARDLIAAFAGPVVAPSANLSGHVSATTAGHVADDLGDSVAVILDDGPCAMGIESTIIGLTGGVARLLRPGAIPRADVEEVLGRGLARPDGGAAKVQAPGMLGSHYAPGASVRLNARSVRTGEAFLGFGAVAPDLAERAVAFHNLSATGDLSEAAAGLFAALRHLDASAEAIAVAPIPMVGLGEAINDRLKRAAAPRPQDPETSSRT